MVKLVDFVNGMNVKAFDITNDKIKQTERNALKKDFLDVLLETLSENGLTVARTNDGIVLTIPSKKDDIYVAIDGVVKNLDYDLDFEIDEYKLKLEKQLERELERKKKAESRK